MRRRQFLSSAAAASALALTGQAQAQSTASGSKREYYQLRTYTLYSGVQNGLTEHYIADALIPALNRRGMTPVGAFSLAYGPETPTMYVIIPSTSVEELALLDLHLGADEEFLKAADPFWNAPAAAPAFQRVEYHLLAAFEGWPKITPSPAAAEKGKRIYQLRTYESPSHKDHVRKVEMFHHGEFAIFARSGCGSVFYGDTLAGSRMPSLTYMLTFPDLAAMDKGWAAFNSDPEWKKLSSDPRFSSERIVSNVSNLVLTPLSCSQV
ncbi:MAG TPA: NIPSNAP family protein [Granulicella sp.]